MIPSIRVILTYAADPQTADLIRSPDFAGRTLFKGTWKMEQPLPAREAADLDRWQATNDGLARAIKLVEKAAQIEKQGLAHKDDLKILQQFILELSRLEATVDSRNKTIPMLREDL
jgi:hypothetical protein